MPRKQVVEVVEAQRVLAVIVPVGGEERVVGVVFDAGVRALGVEGLALGVRRCHRGHDVQVTVDRGRLARGLHGPGTPGRHEVVVVVR